jgi:hypothetical protein
MEFSEEEVLFRTCFSVIDIRNVQFTELALKINHDAKTESNLRKIQLFFANYKLDFQVITVLLMGFVEQKKFRVSIDRTNGVVMEQNKAYFESSQIPILLEFKAYLLKIKGKSIEYFSSKNDLGFSTDMSKPIGGGPTVTYHALQFAHYLGANPVIIVGVDHSFKVAKGDKLSYQKNDADDVNHFDPNYFGKGSIWGVPDLDQSEVVYKIAKEVFENDNRKIYDATVNGKLNVFEKITVSEALRLTQNDKP